VSVKRSRSLLLIAFAISLLLHLIFALNFHRRGSESPTDVEVVRIEHRSIVIRAQKTPPPSPRPRHTPAPLASPAPKPSATGSKPAGNGGKAVATAAPTPAPTAAATVATNPCGRNDAEAALATPPTPPVIPVSARGDGTSGTTIVKVQLDDKGTVLGTTVAQTSGNQALDLIAVGMARDASYTPASHNCKAVAAAYEFSVRFAAW
jgi:TonB family protein